MIGTIPRVVSQFSIRQEEKNETREKNSCPDNDKLIVWKNSGKDACTNKSARINTQQFSGKITFVDLMRRYWEISVWFVFAEVVIAL